MNKHSVNDCLCTSFAYTPTAQAHHRDGVGLCVQTPPPGKSQVIECFFKNESKEPHPRKNTCHPLEKLVLGPPLYAFPISIFLLKSDQNTKSNLLDHVDFPDQNISHPVSLVRRSISFLKDSCSITLFYFS